MKNQRQYSAAHLVRHLLDDSVRGDLDPWIPCIHMTQCRRTGWQVVCPDDTDMGTGTHAYQLSVNQLDEVGENPNEAIYS